MTSTFLAKVTQGGDPNNETLGEAAYVLTPLGLPIPHKIESLTTHDEVLFVGTPDSRIAAYRLPFLYAVVIGASDSVVPLLREVRDGRRGAVRLLTVLGDHHLLALVADTIVLYHFHDDPSRPFQLGEVTAITGLKDTLSFHVKQQKGVLTLAALQRRRLTLYEATFAHLEFMLKETVALPDGVRTFAWMGRSFMLGGRKDYYFYHTSSSSSAALYPTPRSGAAPLILPMAPVPEVLVTADGGGMRALLSDGSEVPGDSSVPWASAPIAMTYEYPFVVTLHAAGTPTLQVRLPLVTTLATTERRAGGLWQYIDLPKAARMSQRVYVDYDAPMPSEATPREALWRHRIVVADTSNRLFWIRWVDVNGQVNNLARRKMFAVAELLCQLCPHLVGPDTVRRVAVDGALHRFLTLHDYAGCFHQLSKIDADPRLAIQLFPGFLRADAGDRCPRLPCAPPSEVTVDALCAFAEYLQARRVGLLLLLGGKANDGGSGGAVTPSAAVLATARALLACVDRALSMAWCVMKSEAPLLALMQAENWCDVAEATELLQHHEQWVALTVFLEAHHKYEEAAQHLRRLVVASRHAEETTTSALQKFFAAHPNLPASDESYLPLSTISAWATTALEGGGDVTTIQSVVRAIVGTTTALTFLRRRSLMGAESYLFVDHISWVLGYVPPENGVRVFLSTANVQHYGAALRLLQGYTEAHGGTPKPLLIVAFLYALFADSRVRLSDNALYAQYWESLGDLLFASPTRILSEAEQQRYRSRLDEFLLTSPHIDLAAAEKYFNAPDVKAKCRPERALVYRRQGRHRPAIDMYVNEARDLAAARAYAGSVRSEDGGDAYTALLELLLVPPPADSDETASSRAEAALEILNSCDGVNAALVLPMLPDTLPFAQLSTFLLQAFRNATTAHHTSALESSVLRARLAQAQETHTRALMRSAVLSDGSVCPACQRKIRPDVLVAVYPSGLVVHQACVKDEHVCPVTNHDFRYDAYSMLEDL